MRTAARPDWGMSRSPSPWRNSSGKRLASAYSARVQPLGGCTVAMFIGGRSAFALYGGPGTGLKTQVPALGGWPSSRNPKSSGATRGHLTPRETTGSESGPREPGTGPATRCHSGGNGTRTVPGHRKLAREENQSSFLVVLFPVAFAIPSEAFPTAARERETKVSDRFTRPQLVREARRVGRALDVAFRPDSFEMGSRRVGGQSQLRDQGMDRRFLPVPRSLFNQLEDRPFADKEPESE